MISKGLQATEAIAREYAENLEPQMDRATVVALSGELGSGKTTFAKAFAAALGLRHEDVTSPTFVIQKVFDLPSGSRWKRLVHIDAYRLEQAHEIERLGWKGLLSDTTALILIEWPENIGAALPKDAQRISFTYKDENTREIVFN